MSAAVALAAVLALFVEVADLLADRHNGLLDHTVLNEAVEHRSTPMTAFMEAVSTAAEIPLMAAAALVALAFAWRSRSWRPPAVSAGAGALSVVLATFVKEVAARTRPPLATAVVTESGFSFPSRHTTVATALLLAMAYLVARRTRTRTAQAAGWAFAVALSVLVAASRVYLGVHWATDVTAGFALGAAAALALITADLGYGIWTGRRDRAAETGSAAQ
ncbi:phosphatase PAP2 family protein [Streptomyces sp. Tu102]|uniref:phosphatase PAP2 family protein n=1 Tax=Streptomyces TaxID=1883 RepID=UPI001BDC5EF4|nr:phosphatase PAP2 family protein [Streptomyces sp. Tu102]MBT1093529.1 phosphatase PAP2 family protein [Streptomyces sp. Tu102]